MTKRRQQIATLRIVLSRRLDKKVAEGGTHPQPVCRLAEHVNAHGRIVHVRRGSAMAHRAPVSTARTTSWPLNGFRRHATTLRARVSDGGNFSSPVERTSAVAGAIVRM